MKIRRVRAVQRLGSTSTRPSPRVRATHTVEMSHVLRLINYSARRVRQSQAPQVKRRRDARVQLSALEQSAESRGSAVRASVHQSHDVHRVRGRSLSLWRLLHQSAISAQRLSARDVVRRGQERSRCENDLRDQEWSASDRVCRRSDQH